MIIKYKILFSIEVLHNYFSSGNWNGITFIPSPETEKLIKEYGFLIKQIRNQILVITKTDLVENKALVLPDLYTRFSFTLRPETPNYINFTNLPINEIGLKCFHYHNLHQNTIGGVNYITAGIEPYVNTVNYKPGAYAKGADSKTYESIKNNNGAQVPDNSNASKEFWVEHGDIQFAGDADTIEKEGANQYPLKLAGDTVSFTSSVKRESHTIYIYSFNAVTGNYDKLRFQDTIRFDEPHDLLQIDLKRLETGKYKLKAEDEVLYVYKSTGAADGVPMFVDIFHLPPGEDQSFLEADNTLKHIKYTIRFGSRRVYWRYKTRTNAIDKIEDTSAIHTFVNDGLKLFISERPIPFSDAPLKTLTANTGALVITTPLPNPQPDKFVDIKDEIFTTESFINF